MHCRRWAGWERQPPTQACYRPFQMRGSIEEHIGAATLEGYSLQELGPEALEATECHLLICAACQKRLAGIEPFNTIHYTRGGPFSGALKKSLESADWCDTCTAGRRATRERAAAHPSVLSSLSDAGFNRGPHRGRHS